MEQNDKPNGETSKPLNLGDAIGSGVALLYYVAVPVLILIGCVGTCLKDSPRRTDFHNSPLSDPELQRDPNDRYRGY